MVSDIQKTGNTENRGDNRHILPLTSQMGEVQKEILKMG